MKTNYKTNSLKKSLISLLTMVVLVCFGAVMAQTTRTVFTDDFNRGATATPLSAGGDPVMDWTTVTTVTPVTATGARTQAALIPDATDDYALRIYPGNSTDGQAAGRTYAYGTLSTFTNSFNAKLSDNTGLVTWTFSFRTNRATAFSGFDGSQYGLAVILAADGSDFLTANGYAVILNRHASTSPKNAVSLVKFTSGLNLNSKVTSIIGPSPTETTDDLRVWFNVKVVYTPSTNTWELYFRKSTTGSYAEKGDPTTASILVGSPTEDATYTGLSLSHCGFLFNHSALTSSNVNSNTVYIDDFKVTVFDPTPVSSVNTQNSSEIKVISEGNNVRIKGAKNAVCKIYSISGQLVADRLIQAEDEVITLSRGMYLVKLGDNRFKVLVK